MVNRTLSLLKVNHCILEGLPVISFETASCSGDSSSYGQIAPLSLPLSQELSQPAAEAKPSEQPHPISELALLWTGDRPEDFLRSLLTSDITCFCKLQMDSVIVLACLLIQFPLSPSILEPSGWSLDNVLQKGCSHLKQDWEGVFPK